MHAMHEGDDRDGWKPPGPGALDDTNWSQELLARAVENGTEDDRLHGYAVLGDVAKHYRFSDATYLAITGELPDARASSLFELALFSFATPSVGEAPVHVAILTRLSGAPLASALGAGLVVAADQARDLVQAHASLFEWLATPAGDPPEPFRGPPQPWVQTLDAAVRVIADADNLLRPELTRDAARIALLYMAGLRTPEHMQAAIVHARLGALTAEALATGPQHLSLYPVKVPPFRYVEDDSYDGTAERK